MTGWRPVPGYPGLHASRDGQIATFEGVLRQRIRADGYATVRHDGQTLYVHRLVCAAFHGPPPSPEHEADHDDRDRGHNRPGNLKWLTPAANLARRVFTRKRIRPAPTELTDPRLLNLRRAAHDRNDR